MTEPWWRRLLERLAPSRPPVREGQLDLLSIPMPDTWRTHCCKEDRPDRVVGVAHVPLTGMEDRFPDTRMNYRYCTDRPACREQAARARVHGGTP